MLLIPMVLMLLLIFCDCYNVINNTTSHKKQSIFMKIMEKGKQVKKVGLVTDSLVIK